MASLRHGFEEPGDVQDIRLVVDTIPTLAWSAGPDGSADFFNQRWLDYTGLSAKQALGSGWEVAIHPDDLPRILETFREALNSVKPYEVEGRFRRFDGEFRWFLFRGSPLRDRSGKVAKWYGTNTDLEERKRAEDALRKHFNNSGAIEEIKSSSTKSLRATMAFWGRETPSIESGWSVVAGSRSLLALKCLCSQTFRTIRANVAVSQTLGQELSKLALRHLFS